MNDKDDLFCDDCNGCVSQVVGGIITYPSGGYYTELGGNRIWCQRCITERKIISEYNYIANIPEYKTGVHASGEE